MKINIVKIYKSNILNKFDASKRENFERFYTSKQQEMWEFTLELIKDNYPIEEYDSEEKNTFLKEYHNIYMCENVVKFTLDEWFNYMNSVQ